MKVLKIVGFIVLAMASQLSFGKGTITLIVPTPPGGGTDTLFRALSSEAEKYLDSTIVVENVGGAGGTIGVTRLVRAKPDGRTIAGVWMSPITVSPHTVDTSYSIDDYIPVVAIDSAPYVMCVLPNFPANTGREMLDVLKAHPGKYTYGDDGVAGPAQLAAEKIFSKFDVKARAIPYGGAGETMPAMLGGVVDIYVGSIPPALGMVEAGKVKCLLLSSARKSTSLPKATSLQELGIPDAQLLLWHGLIAPRGTSDADVEKLQDAFAKAAESEKMTKFFETAGVERDIKKHTEFRQFIQQEYKDLGEQIKELGLGPKK